MNNQTFNNFLGELQTTTVDVEKIGKIIVDKLKEALSEDLLFAFTSEMMELIFTPIIKDTVVTGITVNIKINDLPDVEVASPLLERLKKELKVLGFEDVQTKFVENYMRLDPLQHEDVYSVNYEDKDFYNGNGYFISLNNYNNHEYIVYASHEQEALDKLIDWLEEEEELEGFVMSEMEVDQANDEGVEYITAGNHCYPLSSEHTQMTSIKERLKNERN